MSGRIVDMDWRGHEVLADIQQAIPAAIDETTDACVSTAQSNRSSISGRASTGLESRPASRASSGWMGQWGIFSGDLWWELFIEVGNNQYGGDNAKRNAADSEYGFLAERIKSNRG